MQNEVNFGVSYSISRGAKKKHPHGYFIVRAFNHSIHFSRFALTAA
jgi:hypothetical protein